MCVQFYMSFNNCPCQTRGYLYRCSHYQRTPSCRIVHTQVLKSKRDFCGYHAKLARSWEWRHTRYWLSRRRLLWPAPAPKPMTRKTLASATIADLVRFPPYEDPYDSSDWETWSDEEEREDEDEDEDEYPEEEEEEEEEESEDEEEGGVLLCEEMDWK
ncbi:hypothetical protein F5Y11DRAFT_366248 [Daldinia sp. FL1419]|nr:hypothetical protein F5Y11DRAFT_366248 [Daldinia sp. FL1419]